MPKSIFCTFQIELDKTAEEFRRAHAERQDLILQWENTIEQMQTRDAEMDLLAAVSIFSPCIRLFRDGADHSHFTEIYFWLAGEREMLNEKITVFLICDLSYFSNWQKLRPKSELEKR